MSGWTGSIVNRIEENRMFCDTIEVGTRLTEYFYSDRHPYEVVSVEDQKHVWVRELDHKPADDMAYSNNWILISNPDNPERYLVKRGKYWYWTGTCTLEQWESGDSNMQLRLVVSGFDPEVLKKRGKQTKYSRASVSFGKGDYYYDYSF